MMLLLAKSVLVCRFPLFQHCHYISNFPKLVSNTSSHRSRDAQHLMDAHNIVMHEIDRHGVRVVRNLL